MLAVRAEVALRAVAFHLAVRTGGALLALVFQLPARARVARRAEIFHLAVRAWVALRARDFPLAVRARFALRAGAFQPAVRAGVALSASAFPLPVGTWGAHRALVFQLVMQAPFSHRRYSLAIVSNRISPRARRTSFFSASLQAPHEMSPSIFPNRFLLTTIFQSHIVAVFR